MGGRLACFVAHRVRCASFARPCFSCFSPHFTAWRAARWQVLPYAIEAAGHAGEDAAGLAAALQSALRDKNQALDKLDRVRALVRARLGTGSLLAAGPRTAGAVAKRAVRRPGLLAAAGAAGSSGQCALSGSALANAAESGVRTGPANGVQLDDTASVASMDSSAAHAGSCTSKATPSQAADHVRLPSEYQAVVDQLKARGESAAAIMATHEVGHRVFACSGMGPAGNGGPLHSNPDSANRQVGRLISMPCQSVHAQLPPPAGPFRSWATCMRTLACGSKRVRPGMMLWMRLWGHTSASGDRLWDLCSPMHCLWDWCYPMHCLWVLQGQAHRQFAVMLVQWQ